jgi:hypothetical protein
VPVVAVLPPVATPAMSSAGAPVGPPIQATAVAPVAAPALPTRAPREPVAGVPAVAPEADLDQQYGLTSDLQASALSELRGLYEPSFSPTAAPAATQPGELARRTPRAAQAEPVNDVSGAPRRTRNAQDVRGMLSGFRAGVERGRSTPAEAENETGNAAGNPTS